MTERGGNGADDGDADGPGRRETDRAPRLLGNGADDLAGAVACPARRRNAREHGEPDRAAELLRHPVHAGDDTLMSRSATPAVTVVMSRIKARPMPEPDPGEAGQGTR